MAYYGPSAGGRSEPWRERWPEQPSGPGHPSESYGAMQHQSLGSWESPPYPVVDVPRPGRRPGSPSGQRGAVVAVLVLLAVLLVGGGAAAWYLVGQDDGSPVAAPDEPPTAVPSAVPATPSAAPVSSSAAPQSSADPRFVRTGQCVRNEAPPSDKPKLVIAGCAPDTYQVLRRIDGATSGEKDAQAKCADLDGYTNWFFFNSELDTLDYVLCLKSR